MTKNITSRDWEDLSAYLDGYLTPKERQRLEERLQYSLELKNGLDELRRTRRVLRSQPKMRAPRNFTLTAEMVGAKASRQTTSRFFPVMRLASVLASILLVLVVVGDFWTASTLRTAQMDQASRAVELQAPAAPEAGEVEMPAAVPEAQNYSEKGLEPEATAPAGMMMLAAPTEAPQGTPAAPMEAMSSPAGGGGAPSEALPTATAEAMTPTETPPPAVEIMTAPAETEASAPVPERTYWRTAEILLLLIAVASGVIAIYLRRSSGG